MNLIIFFPIFALYLFTLAPSFTVGDSGEFCASSVLLGLPHSPGYPLFCLLGKVFAVLLPWGNFAYRINILSAIFGAASISVLYKVLVSMDYCREHDDSIACQSLKPAFIISVVMLAVSPAFWRSAVQSEVFALNSFFVSMILLSLQKEKYYLASYLFGLGLGNHHTLVFLFPVLVFAIFKDKLYRHINLPAFAIAAAAGLTIYLYLPIRSLKNPGLDWGNPENLQNLWHVISRQDYGSFALTASQKLQYSLTMSFQQIARFVSASRVQWTIAGFLIGIIGWYFGLRKKYPYALILFILWLFTGPGFVLLANLSFNSEADGILERFYIFSNILLVFPLAWGFDGIVYRFRGVTVFLMIGLLTIIILRFNQINWRNYYLAFDYGRNLLRTLKPNSIFFMDGGDDTFYSMAYLVFAEKRRTDIELHDRGGLVFANIYGKDFRKLPKDLKEKRRQEIERKYLPERPVYYSTFNKEIFPDLKLYPDGVLYRLDEKDVPNSYETYSLRSVYGIDYNDYRSRALVPIYPYFDALRNRENKTEFLSYAFNKWKDVLWIQSNLKIELAYDAFTELNSGRFEKARTIYERIISLYGNDTPSLLNLGVIAEKTGKLEQAKAYYRKALEIDPKNLDAYYNMSVLFWKESNWKEVISYLNMLLEINPGDARAKYYLPLAEKRLRGRELVN